MANKIYISAHIKGDFSVKSTNFPPTDKRVEPFGSVELTQPGGDITFFLCDKGEADILRDAFAAIQALRQAEQVEAA